MSSAPGRFREGTLPLLRTDLLRRLPIGRFGLHDLGRQQRRRVAVAVLLDVGVRIEVGHVGRTEVEERRVDAGLGEAGVDERLAAFGRPVVEIVPFRLREPGPKPPVTCANAAHTTALLSPAVVRPGGRDGRVCTVGSVIDPTVAADHVDALEREGRALARTATAAPQAAISTCPGWSMTDLLVHLGSWHRWVTGIVADAELEPRRPPAEQLPDGADPVGWYIDQLDGLTGVLRRTDPTAPTWTVTTDHRAGAWAGRQAGETAVHRWDADHAAGQAEPIMRAEAYLEEWLGEVVPNILPFLGRVAPAGRLGLELTDSGRRLVLAAAGDTSELRSDDSTATDVTMQGTASDVLLALGGRPSSATTTGDDAVLRDWRSVLN